MVTTLQKNQYFIKKEIGNFFQSYSSLIAFSSFSHSNYILLNEEKYNYSKTTSKYLYQFLCIKNKSELEKLIKSGKAVLVSEKDIVEKFNTQN